MRNKKLVVQAFILGIIVATILTLINLSSAIAQEPDLPSITIENMYIDENLKIYGEWNFTSGTTCYVKVIVHKPEGIKLSAGKWRVGIFLSSYGYPNGSCFNKGTWQEIEPGVWFYTGWREAKIENVSWENLEAGEMEFITPIHVVDYPRPAEDVQHGMVNRTTTSLKVTAYLEIDNVNHSVDNENQVTFEIGDNTFTLPFVRWFTENVDNMNVLPWRGEQLWLVQYSTFINVSTDTLVARATRDAKYGIIFVDTFDFLLSRLVIISIALTSAIIAITLVILKKRKLRKGYGPY